MSKLNEMFDEWYQENEAMLGSEFLWRKGLARLAWGAEQANEAEKSIPDATCTCGWIPQYNRIVDDDCPQHGSHQS